MTIRLTDDFLTKAEYKVLFDTLFFQEFPWHYNEYKVNVKNGETEAIENFQFVHPFFRAENHYGGLIHKKSEYFNLILPILSRIEYIGLYRIKANMQPLFKEPYISDYHTDYSDEHGACDHMTTGIYYLNTCNGYTEFEDGSKVGCRANRYIQFPSNLKHRGVSQTDMRIKSVININFFTPHLNGNGEAETNCDK